MNTTTIEWAERTWNPVTGCSPISEGCENCYAKRMAQRLRGRCGYPENDPFKATRHPDRLLQPLKLRKPSRIFVCSMGDLFHEDVPDKWIDQIFAIMALAPQHTYILLTKRPERMQEYFGNKADWVKRATRAMRTAQRINYQLYEQRMANEFNWDPAEWEHLWLGVTAENQARADERIPILLQIPAAVRFVSCEPLLEHIYLNLCCKCQAEPQKCSEHNRLDWVIAGGETGPGARPMHPDWARSLREQCQDSGVPFLFKQWGEWAPIHELRCGEPGIKGRRWFNFDPDTTVCKVGKKRSGRLLDGRIWDEYPGVMT